MISPSRRDLFTLGIGMSLQSCTSKSAAHPSLAYSRLPDLPTALGGQMAGVHNGALFVAGGSYFETPPWDGGIKCWVDSIFVLTQPDAAWQTFRLPAAMGYAASVSTPQGLVLIGGGDSESNRSEVLCIQWDGSAIEIANAAPLPAPLANCAAGYLNGKVWVMGGQHSPGAVEASAALYSFDPAAASAQWQQESPLPAEGRILPSVGVVDHCLYVAGGASLHEGTDGKPARRYLRDAWRYSSETGWEALPALPTATVAAPCFGLGSHFFIFGGDDGRLADQPHLRERHPGFPRDVRALDTGTLQWKRLGTMPAGLVTTTATAWRGHIVIPGGEDRPAHRSAEVYSVSVTETAA